jgi:hypothetical protein
MLHLFQFGFSVRSNVGLSLDCLQSVAHLHCLVLIGQRFTQSSGARIKVELLMQFVFHLSKPPSNHIAISNGTMRLAVNVANVNICDLIGSGKQAIA